MAEIRRRKYRDGAATGIDLSLRYLLEEGAASYGFDMAREMVQELSQRHSIDDLIERVRAAKVDGADALLSSFGEQFMASVMELADGKYEDRTGQLVKKVAERTGIWFPDTFRRYAEMSALGLRPFDRCNVIRATSKEYVFQQYSCSIQEKLNANSQGASAGCESLCLASLQTAAKNLGRRIDVELRKQLPKDDMCEFYCRPVD